MPLEEESLKQKAKKLLLELVSIYTPSGEEYRAKEFFEKVSNEYGLKLYISKTNSYFIGKGNILLTSHIDTVPGFLEPKDEGDIIYGRGTVDAKGPLISMLMSVILLSQEGINVTFGALAGEETTSYGALELLESKAKYNAIIIGEPTSTYNIGIEYRGSYKIKVKCHDAPAHSSSSQSNIILEVTKKIIETSALPAEYDKPVIVPTLIKGGEVHNVSPKDVEIIFDVRYSINVKDEEILNRFNTNFRDCEVNILDHTLPVKVSPNTGVVRALMRGLLTQGFKPRLVRKNGTSDMNLLYQITSNIAAYGPGDSRLEHTSFEKINTEELLIGIKTYYYSVKELLANNNLLINRI